MWRTAVVSTLGGVRVADSLLERFDRWRELPPLVVDAVLAVVVAAVTIVAVVVNSTQDDEPMSAWGWLLLAAQLVPLIWRRRAPVTVAVVTMAAAALLGMAELPEPPVMFAPLLALYTAAAHRPRSVTVPLAAVIMLGAAVAIFFGDSTDAADVAVGYFTGISAWVIGDTARSQREHTALLESRRADAARQAASEERVRIARDLHDIVAHHVSVIAVQAEAAQEVLATRPDRAAEAMASVADTARTALAELRKLLGVLRSPTDLAPQPDLAAVDELVESVRQAGLQVEVSTTGEPRPVDSMVGVTAYRVVQEALTNVIKHAGRCRARVSLDFGPDDLVVTVTDDGRQVSAARADVNGGGQGLLGMRERVTILGGSLDAGPRPGDGGFAVRARLPLAPA